MSKLVVFEVADGGQMDFVAAKYMLVDMSKPYAPHVFEFVRDMEKSKGVWDAPDKFEDYVRQL